MSALAQYKDMPDEIDALSRSVIDSVFSVHKELGPGYSEKIYEEALALEFSCRNIPFESQKPYAVNYKGNILQSTYKLDMIVGNSIVLELKTVDAILPVHEAQIISYMNLASSPLGFIINFNQVLIKHGIKRVVLSRHLRNFASSR